MKHYLLSFICLAVLIAGFVSCGKQGKSGPSANYDYKAMYKDSFDILLSREYHDPPTLDDTLYAEMYIALKTCGKDEEHFSQESADIVIDRVNRLLAIDTVPENQRHYLEAKLMVCGMKKDFKGFMDTNYQIYNTYPYNSIERLSSLGCHYLILHNNDSASYYLNKTIEVANQQLNSDDSEMVGMAAVNIVSSLIYLHKDEEAKAFINENIAYSQNQELVETLKDIDFDEWKRMMWKMVYDMQMKLKRD